MNKRQNNDDEAIKADKGGKILTEDMLKKALQEIKDPDFAKITGLIAHISYWCIFGHINKTKMNSDTKEALKDTYQMDDFVKGHFLLSAFVEISKIKSKLDMKYMSNDYKMYTSLVMPILIL